MTTKHQDKSQQLADRLVEICEEYTIEQVSDATFTILMMAIDLNDEFTEKESVLAIVLAEVSKVYNELVIQSRKPTGLSVH